MSLTRRGKIATILSVLLGLLAAAAVGGYVYLRSIGAIGSSEPGRPVEIRIPEGASAIEVGRLLEEAGVIESTLGWRVALYLEGGGDDIEAGNYNLFAGLSAPDALALLAEGATVDFTTVTFPEGSWIEDFVRIVGRDTHISSAAFERALESGRVTSELKPPNIDTFEGLLFPSTYQVVEDDTAVTLAQRIVDEFEAQVATIDWSRVEEMGYS
ncbi:MAG: endolytic transglycosylase MltG, partial [Actinomycetota bacterium]|nr:endolytic transglycosylase MltG [Actinomycetota bacterium]